MTMTITLKNIPDELYNRLKASAKDHRRSLNSEALVCLEAAVMAPLLSTEDLLSGARSIRQSLGDRFFSDKDIDRFKREGRK